MSITFQVRLLPDGFPLTISPPNTKLSFRLTKRYRTRHINAVLGSNLTVKGVDDMVDMIEFQVVGRWPFPNDMLRHDQCWPSTEMDADTMQAVDAHHSISSTGRVVITLRGLKEPNVERWKSYLWNVVPQSPDGARNSPRSA